MVTSAQWDSLAWAMMLPPPHWHPSVGLGGKVGEARVAGRGIQRKPWLKQGPTYWPNSGQT